MKKRVVSMLLTVSMLAALLVGCGGTDDKESGSAGKMESGGGEDSVSEGDASASETPVDIRVFSYFSAADEPEWSKFILEELQKAVNIKLTRDEIPRSAYQERLQLAMSDGDYPDAFLFDSHEDTLLLDAVDNGLILPLNEYLESGNYPNLEKYIYDGAWEAAKVKNDDQIYLIPRCSVSRVDGYAVRDDWMENVGFSFSSDDTTMTKEEFLDLMKRFTEDDPDGDGVDNTYGLIWENINGNLNTIADGAFGCMGWQESDGEYEYMDLQYELHSENYKELLAYNQELYKYAHPDSIVTTDPDSVLYSGQVGVRPIFAGNVAGRLLNLNEVDPDASLSYTAGVVNDEGDLKGAALFPGIWGGTAITKNCEHPEKVLEMLDWILSDQAWEYALWGIPGEIYEKSEDGSCKIINPEEYSKQKTVGIWATFQVRRKEDTNFFLDLSLDQETLDEVKGWLDTAVEAVEFSKNYGRMPEISTDTTFIEAENTRKEAITKIIMGAMEVDEYDNVLENWYNKGGTTYVEQMNEIIKSMQ